LTDLAGHRHSKDLVETLSRLQHYFSVVDLDDSGSLSFDEFLYLAFLLIRDGGYVDVIEKAADPAIVKTTLLDLHAAFFKVDTDKSMRLDRTELHKLLTTMFGEVPKGADEIFARLMSSQTRQHIDFVRLMRLLYELVRGQGAGYAHVDEARRPAKPSSGFHVPTATAAPKYPRVDSLDPKEVKREKQIGEGGFGKVYKATFRGQTVAAKWLIDTATPEVCRETEEEIKLMKSLESPNIVWLVGACTKMPEICIVLEFCANGSLFDCMHKRRMQV